MNNADTRQVSALRGVYRRQFRFNSDHNPDGNYSRYFWHCKHCPFVP